MNTTVWLLFLGHPLVRDTSRAHMSHKDCRKGELMLSVQEAEATLKALRDLGFTVKWALQDRGPIFVGRVLLFFGSVDLSLRSVCFLSCLSILTKFAICLRSMFLTNPDRRVFRFEVCAYHFAKAMISFSSPFPLCSKQR